MHEHISRLDTNTNDPGQPPNHGVGPGLRLLLQSFLTSVLDLPDLADNQAQPRHVALQLGQGVGRQRHALRGVHGCQTLSGLAQGWFEVANAQPGQGGLYPVYNARAFPHQAFALPVWPLGVLFGNRWHARHAAMTPFATQPPQEPALEQLGVEPVGFRPAMFPRNGHTRGMDHVRLYPMRRKPARQPKAVAAGFEGQRNPRDRAAGPDRLIPPAMQQAKQPFWARIELLARLTLNPGKHAGNQPTPLAHLDDGYDRAISVQGDEGPAQVVRLGHQGTPSVGCSDDGAISSPPAPYHLSAGGRRIRTPGPTPWFGSWLGFVGVGIETADMLVHEVLSRPMRDRTDRVGRDAQGFPFRGNRRQYLCRAIFQYRSAADVGGENATPVPTKSGLRRAQRALDL